MRFTFTRVSGNSKTGPIPTVLVSRDTCPPSCPLYGGGCYALGGMVRIHWDRVPERGIGFAQLIHEIKGLAHKQVWRYAVAGDLPGSGEKINPVMINQLVAANRGRRGFTYTHKNPHNAHNATLIQRMNKGGFTVNLSSNNLSQADTYLGLGIAPVVTLIPADAGDWRTTQTPGGNKVVRCPAEYSESTTCANCGGGTPLCQRSDRKYVVGFTAHGASKRKTSDVARGSLRVLQ